MPPHEFPTPTGDLSFTGERYVPAAPDKIQHEHYHRYLWALQLCAGKRVVDVACGEGYGAALLATVAESVLGFDIAPEAISHAVSTYSSPHLWFKVADAASLPVEDASVDVVVSFETIEHLENPEDCIAEIRRILRP